jgi:hypothetical protein
VVFQHAAEQSGQLVAFVRGQRGESALGAILGPLLARAGTTFNQWLVLTVTAASGFAIDRDQLVTRITGARKIDRRPRPGHRHRPRQR